MKRGVDESAQEATVAADEDAAFQGVDTEIANFFFFFINLQLLKRDQLLTTHRCPRQ